MAYQYVGYETSDRIARVILNRPEKLNAMCYDMREEIVSALKKAERDDAIRVIIIKGAGRCFSTGVDLTPADPSPNYPVDGYVSPRLDHITGQYRKDLLQAWGTIWDLCKPVVAQIHGYCLVGAVELTGMCDLRIVAEDAQIGFPVARTMGLGNVFHQPWLLGITKAKEFMFTGDPMDGKEAVRAGWATRCYPASSLEEETEKLAGRIALIETDLIALTKRAINRSYEIMGFKAALDTAADLCTLQQYRESGRHFQETAREKGLKAALEERDSPFGDYRGSVKPSD